MLICFGEGNPPYPPYGSSMPVYETNIPYMEYWSANQGKVGCGRQNLYRITAFDSK